MVREGEVGHEPRFEHFWSMLDIGSLNAMWACSWTTGSKRPMLYISCQWHYRPPEYDPLEAGSYLASIMSLTLESDRGTDTSSAPQPAVGLIFVLASHQIRLDTRSMTRRSVFRRSIMNRGSSPTGLCWTSAHLMQYCYIAIKISITTLIQTQAVRASLFLSTFSPWRHEERDANHKSIC